MENINFSIIIPHKNIPDLLQRCLDFIPERDDVQVIVVDDNSDAQIVDFDHFPGKGRKNTEIYFTKKGGGAGYARNVGLGHAQGKLVLFVDADDFFTEKIGQILDQTINAQEDLVFFYPKAVKNDDLSAPSPRMDYVINYFDKRDELTLRCKVDIPACKIIRRELIEENNIRFHEVKKSNDAYFSAMVGGCAKSLKVLDEVGYVATDRAGSLASHMCTSYPDLKDRLQEALESEEFLRKNAYIHPKKASDYFMELAYGEKGFVWCLGFCVRYLFSAKARNAMALFLVNRAKKKLQKTKWRLYHRYLDTRVFFIRRKKKIRFCFILQGITQWPTENLYLAMLEHPRFEPVLCIAPSYGRKGMEKISEDYCKAKGYEYITLKADKTIKSQIKADFVVHEQPYNAEINPAHSIDRNRRTPVVVIPYLMCNLKQDWFVNSRTNILCWRHFVNVKNCLEEYSKIHKLKGINYRLTGVPIMDELLKPKDSFPDVWPCCDGRKRIIYAPHHSIVDMHWEGMGISTFLENCRLMLELRDKYKDKAYFVFKPHPRLKYNLSKYWGEEKADAYYKEWEQPGVSHVEEGRYVALFKHSDALIHDCSSFVLEYMYTGNPVLYLVRDENHTDNMLSFARKAMDLHYKARNAEDIETFITDVIYGNDPLKEKRCQYVENYLLPPNGRSACENIINSILGKD